MNEIAIGVISSLVASGLFLLFLRNLRPKIQIAKKIAKAETDEGLVYVFKFINRGRRNIVDIRAQLMLVTHEHVVGGAILKTKELKSYSALILNKYDKNDNDAHYARRFTFKEKLDEIWTDDNSQYLMFRVFCHDEVSGFGKVFSQEFRLKRASIVNGVFNYGEDLNVS